MIDVMLTSGVQSSCLVEALTIDVSGNIDQVQVSGACVVYSMLLLNDSLVKIQLLAFRTNFVTRACDVCVRRYSTFNIPFGF